MKPIGVSSSYIYINFQAENNDKDPKFEPFDLVRILSYKNIFAEGYAPN